MRNLSFWEIALIVLAVVLLFGAGKLPQLGRSVGEGIREFKKSIKNTDEDANDEKKS